MMGTVDIHIESTVSEVLSQWPETISVFSRHHMACIGCTMSPYETISGAARIYKLTLQDFIQDLQVEIESASPES